MVKQFVSKQRTLGFTLVELMVSILIAAIIFAGVINVVLSGKRTFQNEEEVSFIQENARYALEVMSRDIRMAGYTGCASRSNAKIANVVKDDMNDLLTLDAIQGFEGGVGTAGFPDDFKAAVKTTGPGATTDALILRYADETSAASLASHSNPVNGKINTFANHSFKSGEKLLVVDASCRHFSLFEASNVAAKEIGHGVGAGKPGNCTKVLKATVDNFSCSSSPCNAASCGPNAPESFAKGSKIMRYLSHAYYVGDSNVIAGLPALKRVSLGVGNPRTEELVQGVEDLEITYGEDLDGNGDINRIVTADKVTNWDDVISVRVSIVFRSQGNVFEQNQTVTLNGTTYNDKLLRQYASNTVRLRNR